MKENTQILVTGSDGQLGREIKELASNFTNFNFFFTSKIDLDITIYEAVEVFMMQNKINCIINCAAYTNVDKAEVETELADKINHLAVKNLALLAKKHNIKLIHISTDYVFDGNSEESYSETDTTNPQNEYGKSKLRGENALLEINPPNSVLIRTSWLYSQFGHNFVKTILKLAKEKDEINVVSDQFGSPTYASDLAFCILNLLPKIKNTSTEIFHFSNEGTCSWFEFAQEIVKNVPNNCKVKPISSIGFNSKAYRPKFSLLNTSKIKKVYGISISNWKNSLKKCVLKLNSF